MKHDNEYKLRVQILELQKVKLIERWERMKRRDAFVKNKLPKILALSMQGWPRLNQMKDKAKWIDLVFDAKIKGIYSMGTANCDVIAQLERKAKEIKESTIKNKS